MKKTLLNVLSLVNMTALMLILSLSLNAQTTKKSTSAKKPITLKKGPTSEKSVVVERERVVLITTNFGNIKVKLYNQTPKHRDNFVKLAQTGFLDSTLFHRVIPQFMIQGGDPQSKNAGPDQMLGGGDIGYKVPAEFVDALYHKRGALAAARDNNPEMQSSGCQFYIVQGKPVTNQELDALEARTGKKYTAEQRKTYTSIGGTPFLDHSYTVFGEVIEGMDVVDKIESMPTGAADRPREDVRMMVKLLE